MKSKILLSLVVFVLGACASLSTQVPIPAATQIPTPTAYISDYEKILNLQVASTEIGADAILPITRVSKLWLDDNWLNLAAVDFEDGLVFYGEDKNMEIMAVRALDANGEAVSASFLSNSGIVEEGYVFKFRNNDWVLLGARTFLKDANHVTAMNEILRDSEKSDEFLLIVTEEGFLGIYQWSGDTNGYEKIGGSAENAFMEKALFVNKTDDLLLDPGQDFVVTQGGNFFVARNDHGEIQYRWDEENLQWIGSIDPLEALFLDLPQHGYRYMGEYEINQGDGGAVRLYNEVLGVDEDIIIVDLEGQTTVEGVDSGAHYFYFDELYGQWHVLPIFVYKKQRAELGTLLPREGSGQPIIVEWLGYEVKRTQIGALLFTFIVGKTSDGEPRTITLASGWGISQRRCVEAIYYEYRDVLPDGAISNECLSLTTWPENDAYPRYIGYSEAELEGFVERLGLIPGGQMVIGITNSEAMNLPEEYMPYLQNNVRILRDWTNEEQIVLVGYIGGITVPSLQRMER